MAIKTETGWKCSYCSKQYTDPIKADTCREEHDLVYVQLPRSDLNRLINFIFTKEDRLLTENITKTLQKALRNSRPIPNKID